jgi:integrase
MAFVEQRGDWFRIIFRYAGQRYSHTLKTKDPSVADGLKGGIEKTLMLLEQEVLQVPEGIDVLPFVLGNGQIKNHQAPPEKASNGDAPSPVTLQELKDRYIRAHSAGAMEKNSLDTVAMHLRHFVKSFGSNFSAQTLTPIKLQEHIDRRAKRKGIHKRPLSPTTIRKEIASLRAAWNWAVQMDFISNRFPNRGLKYPKSDEKPPFQTWQEIERQIERGGLTEGRQKELWDCLFLTLTEVQEFLSFVKGTARHPFLFPMSCFAAHTGARRSEILRVQISDLDLEAGTVLIHEKKRARGKRTTRRLPLSPFLAAVLEEWLAVHPGGQFLFCHELRVFRSKKRRLEFAPLTRNEANDHFKRTVAGSKWEKLRGWHIFRHSFASNCAAKGIDQRIIDEWTGHQTEEMRRRYRHLFPNQQQEAIRSVFG